MTLANKLILKGSHGTSKENAFEIKKTGKFLLTAGSLGEGVYFWGEENFLEKLAEAWAKYRLSEGKYGKNTNVLCVLLVKILTHQNRVFHIDSIRGRVAKEMEKRGYDMSNTSKVSKFFDVIIQEIQKELGQKFQVLKGEIPLPSKDSFCENFPYKNILRSALCYVVRDTECIKIEKTYEVIV